MYAHMLCPYFESFPREQMLIVRFEDIIDEPRRLAERVQRFVGIDVRPHDADELGVINPAEGRDVEMPDAVRRELESRYAEPNRELARMLGPSFPMWT